MAKVDLLRRAQIGRERRARSRKQLVGAARALFAAGPLESVTVEAAASAAGLAKGTFYAHFPSLEELWTALGKDLAFDLAQSLEPIATMASDPLERIALGCAVLVERAFGDPAWGALTARAMWTFPDVLGAIRDRFAEDLRATERQGRLPTLSPEVGFDLVFGAVSQAVWSASAGKLPPSEASSIIAGIVRSLGVSAKRAERIAAKVSSLLIPEASSRRWFHEDIGKDVFDSSEA